MRIERFEDLIRALREHPEWLEELRTLILTEELLALPGRFTAFEVRAEQRHILSEERHDRAEERHDRAERRHDRTEARLDSIDGRLDRMDQRLATLEGEAVERRYREHGAGYFGTIARRIRLMSRVDRDTLLDELEDAGTLTGEEADAIRLCDGIFTARLGDAVVFLLLEASRTVAHHDVTRAAERAALLARSGTPVLPIAAGQTVPPDVADSATRAGVYVVTNGSVGVPA